MLYNYYILLIHIEIINTIDNCYTNKLKTLIWLNKKPRAPRNKTYLYTIRDRNTTTEINSKTLFSQSFFKYNLILITF